MGIEQGGGLAVAGTRPTLFNITAVAYTNVRCMQQPSLNMTKYVVYNNLHCIELCTRLAQVQEHRGGGRQADPGARRVAGASLPPSLPLSLYTHTHVRTHARTHTRAHARAHARTHAHVRTHTFINNNHGPLQSVVPACSKRCIHTFVSVCSKRCIHIFIYQTKVDES